MMLPGGIIGVVFVVIEKQETLLLRMVFKLTIKSLAEIVSRESK